MKDKKSTCKTLPKSFEERVERLQVIVTTLEKGDVALEQSVELYKEGMQLSMACREQLEKARHDITLYTENTDSPFLDNQAIQEDK